MLVLPMWAALLLGDLAGALWIAIEVRTSR